ncbi:unnamed protein product [Didymodactylos carnosus]|uniref:MGS-like domain-containing protein n=1 Tax=Didymodactylos carnosus TaxID=1234261 RepID=A0A814V4W2_9BILA|nr:unnamed protein product [Didymodactylos carnosus]CAF1186335.1 unnamed protein product [Didymodactylos carnosus]CAF3694647.1 unnamed protein product [Didymodactylos carnosus]CAF3950578.1 unnamed protein product [Didymodactylos carnosus]
MVAQQEQMSFQVGKRKRIALVAHDNKKPELLEWVKRNRQQLLQHELYGTGTTGKLVEQELGTTVIKYKSGPLGGDQQLGAKKADQMIDILIFMIDPLTAQPHDVDVKALQRIAVVWNIPMAWDLATADFILTSPYMKDTYTREVPSFSTYLNRTIP